MTVRLLTTEEVAERFRTSPSTVRYWRHLGIGPAGFRVGRRVLYDEAECAGWVLVGLGFALAMVFNSAGWVALGVIGALIEGGAALRVGLRR